MNSIRFRLTTSVFALILALICNIALGLYFANQATDNMSQLYSDRIVPLRELKIVADMYAVNIVDTSHKINNGNMEWAKDRHWSPRLGSASARPGPPIAQRA